MFIQNKIFSRCYSVQAEIWKDDSQLGCASDPIYSFAKKNQYSFRYGFPNFTVLLIDSVLSRCIFDK